VRFFGISATVTFGSLVGSKQSAFYLNPDFDFLVAMVAIINSEVEHFA
jgi:hypothetical protein